MAKHLIDTDLYIDLIQSGRISSIVAQELLAGARSLAGRRRVETLFRPFERVGRVVTPGHHHWKDAGAMLARVLRVRSDLKAKLPGLVNDCLLALSARSIGATLYTRNRDDFMLLRSIRSFALVVIS